MHIESQNVYEVALLSTQQSPRVWCFPPLADFSQHVPVRFSHSPRATVPEAAVLLWGPVTHLSLYFCQLLSLLREA